MMKPCTSEVVSTDERGSWGILNNYDGLVGGLDIITLKL